MGEMSDYYLDQDMSNGEADDFADTRLNSEHHWRTNDGRFLSIRGMADSHLNNTIAFLERKGALSALAVKDGTADLAQKTEHQILPFPNLSLKRYENMVREQKRRMVGVPNG